MNNDWIVVLLTQTVLFFFPAYIGNLSPVIFSKFGVFKTLFDRPLDGGNYYGDKRMFGKNKTVGGLIFGSIGGVIGAFLMYLSGYLAIDGEMEFWHFSPWFLYLLFGLLMGFGAMIGDLVKSFVKRRIGIVEGKSWWIFDQDDFVVGAWLFSGILIPYSQSWQMFLVALIITPPLHLFANFVAYLLKLKKVWW